VQSPFFLLISPCRQGYSLRKPPGFGLGRTNAGRRGNVLPLILIIYSINKCCQYILSKFSKINIIVFS
jgi:hypothetical protein